MIGEEALFDAVDPFLKQHVFEKFTGSDPDDLKARFAELLKFLYLSSKYPELRRTFIPVTQEVDDLWHELILQTAFYQRLCAKLPGGEIIHHQSIAFGDYQQMKTPGDLSEEILRWVPLYVANFGGFQEDRLKHWFFVRLAKQTLGLSLDELNRYAQESAKPVPRKPRQLQWKRWAEATPEGGLDIHAGERSTQMVDSDGTGDELVAFNGFGADVIRFAAGKGVKKHVHQGDHILFVIRGTGTVTFYDDVYELAPGVCYLIPGDAPHAIDARTDLVLLAVGNHRFPVGSRERMALWAEDGPRE